MSVFLAVVYNNYRKHLKVICMSLGLGVGEGSAWAEHSGGEAGSAFANYLGGSSSIYFGGSEGSFGILPPSSKWGVSSPPFMMG